MKIYIRYYYSGFDCLVVGGRKSRTENGGTFCNCAKYSGLFLFFTFFLAHMPPVRPLCTIHKCTSKMADVSIMRKKNSGFYLPRFSYLKFEEFEINNVKCNAIFFFF